MKILTNNQKKQLENLLVANQVIFNSYNTLQGFEQIQAFSNYCDNTANALFILGGSDTVDAAKQFIFTE